MAFAIRAGNPMSFGCERTLNEFRPGKLPVVLERRDHTAHFADPRHLDKSADEADPIARVCEHLAPRSDDQRMAKAAPSAGMLPPLRRRQDKTAVLDRPRAQQ